MGIFKVPRHVQFFYVLNVPFLFIIVECLLKKRRIFTMTQPCLRHVLSGNAIVSIILKVQKQDKLKYSIRVHILSCCST